MSEPLTPHGMTDHGPAKPLPDISDADFAAAPSPPPPEWYGEQWVLPPLELPARVFDEIDAAKREAESSFVRDCQADIDAATCQECGGPLGDTYTMKHGVRYCSMCASVGGE